MTYAQAAADITARRKALGWNRGQLGNAARLSRLSIYKFEAGLWPDTDYRDFIQEQLQAALGAEETKRAAVQAPKVSA